MVAATAIGELYILGCSHFEPIHSKMKQGMNALLLSVVYYYYYYYYYYYNNDNIHMMMLLSCLTSSTNRWVRQVSPVYRQYCVLASKNSFDHRNDMWKRQRSKDTTTTTVVVWIKGGLIVRMFHTIPPSSSCKRG
jgi:hypothetical protein